jgi:hypothetical protein
MARFKMGLSGELRTGVVSDYSLLPILRRGFDKLADIVQTVESDTRRLSGYNSVIETVAWSVSQGLTDARNRTF